MKKTRRIILATGVSLLALGTVGPAILALLTGGPDRGALGWRGVVHWFTPADPLDALNRLAMVFWGLLYLLAVGAFATRLWRWAADRRPARPAPARSRSKYLFWGQGDLRGRGGASARHGRARRRRPASPGGASAQVKSAPVAEAPVSQTVHPGI